MANIDKTRLSLADSLAEDHECSDWVINRIRVIEGQYDELFKLAEGVGLYGDEAALGLLAQFLLAQKRRFSDKRDSQYKLGTLGRIYEKTDDHDYSNTGG